MHNTSITSIVYYNCFVGSLTATENNVREAGSYMWSLLSNWVIKDMFKDKCQHKKGAMRLTHANQALQLSLGALEPNGYGSSALDATECLGV